MLRWCRLGKQWMERPLSSQRWKINGGSGRIRRGVWHFLGFFGRWSVRRVLPCCRWWFRGLKASRYYTAEVTRDRFETNTHKRCSLELSAWICRRKGTHSVTCRSSDTTSVLLHSSESTLFSKAKKHILHISLLVYSKQTDRWDCTFRYDQLGFSYRAT